MFKVKLLTSLKNVLKKLNFLLDWDFLVTTLFMLICNWNKIEAIHVAKLS